MAYPALNSDDRIHARRMIRSPGSLILQNGGTVPVRFFDISINGAGVISQVNLKHGFSCHLKASLLLLPTMPSLIKHPVEVRYNVYSYNDGGFRIGLQFQHIDKDIIEAIRQYVGAGKHKIGFR